jgi:hypothetical protein
MWAAAVALPRYLGVQNKRKSPLATTILCISGGLPDASRYDRTDKVASLQCVFLL